MAAVNMEYRVLWKQGLAQMDAKKDGRAKIVILVNIKKYTLLSFSKLILVTSGTTCFCINQHLHLSAFVQVLKNDYLEKSL